MPKLLACGTIRRDTQILQPRPKLTQLDLSSFLSKMAIVIICGLFYVDCIYNCLPIFLNNFYLLFCVVNYYILFQKNCSPVSVILCCSRDHFVSIFMVSLWHLITIFQINFGNLKIEIQRFFFFYSHRYYRWPILHSCLINYVFKD